MPKLETVISIWGRRSLVFNSITNVYMIEYESHHARDNIKKSQSFKVWDKRRLCWWLSDQPGIFLYIVRRFSVLQLSCHSTAFQLYIETCDVENKHTYWYGCVLLCIHSEIVIRKVIDDIARNFIPWPTPRNWQWQSV